MAAPVDYAKLRDQTLASTEEEEAVTVNTRALIDKVLARYSGEWTTLRELIQNAADASASNVKIKFETFPSSSVPVPQNADLPTRLKHTVLHHTLRRLLVFNDGLPFGANDWARLKRIAEGNPDETKIGAFGVGFYSVFSECETPFISSGKETMAFYWKGNSLYTRKGMLPEGASDSETCFVLDYRNTSSQVPDLMSICQFLCSSLTFVGLESIELWLDEFKLFILKKSSTDGVEVKIPKEIETKTKEGMLKIAKVEAQRAQIDATWMNIIGWTPSTSEKGRSFAPDSDGKSSAAPSLRTFFSRLTGSGQNNAAAKKAAKEEEDAQRAIADDIAGLSQAKVFIRISTVNIQTQVSKAFAAELERATKKPPPKHTKIAVLTSSYDEATLSQATLAGTASKKAADLMNSILPVKNGRVFIGFPTVQTTGLLAHISIPSLIPTVERESIDLNARYVRTWNMELLNVAGIACRIAYGSEMTSLRNALKGLKPISANAVLSPSEMSTVIPAAVHTLQQFSFRESTPLPKAGQSIEEAFWACSKSETIEMLSSCGVLSSNKIRIASENLSFVSGIPVIPDDLLKGAKEFIGKLLDFGFISEITTADIKNELKKQPLSEFQLEEFLKWTAQKAKAGQLDVTAISTLFEDTVVNLQAEQVTDSSGKFLMLEQIKTFVNSARVPPEMPMPPETIPFKYTRSLAISDMRTFGWEELQIVPWVRWLIEGANNKALPVSHDIRASPSFAASVLPVLSRVWDTLSQSSKETVVELLSDKTVIPTKMGMRKPSQSYFASVKLFDDLPTITNVNGVKEKFLKALGVRKTIDLAVIFERLMANSTRSTSQNNTPQWSHVELIRYLVSVWTDIPNSDLDQLRKTPICPAEDPLDRSKPSSQLFTLASLFEPKDPLRSLGLSVLQWPSRLDPYSIEGKFMKSLGLRSYPTVPEIVEILLNFHSSGNNVGYESGVKYFLENHYSNNYGAFDFKNSTKAFLPIQTDAKRLAKPSTCYTNPSSSFLGYQLLRQDLRPHALKFGVQADPPILDCAQRLIQSPPKSRAEAREMFSYFGGRLVEISSQAVEMLKSAPIVPVFSESGEKKTKVRHIPPSSCFLGNSDEYGEIFTYVDFGHEANLFLLKLGSSHEPSITQLTQLLVREPARLLQTFNDYEKYLALLRKVNLRASDLKKDKVLWKEMKTAPFLLAYKEVRSDSVHYGKYSDAIDASNNTWDDEMDQIVKEWNLASARDIVLVDDVITYTLFRDKLQAAPQEEALESLYFQLGVPSLNSLVEDDYRSGPKESDQQLALQLKTRILERSRLFFHDLPDGVLRKDPSWLEKNLEVQLVKSLSLRRSLRGYNVSHTDKRNAALGSAGRSQCLLSITPGFDYWFVSQEIVNVLLDRPKHQYVLLFETVLTTPLEKLRSRGFNVDRILRRKTEEARIAKIERQRLEENERKRIEAQPTSSTANGSTPEPSANGNKQHGSEYDSPGEELVRQNPMPGAFLDSPEPPPRVSKRPGRSILSQLTRQLGFNSEDSESSPFESLVGGGNNGYADDPSGSGPPPYSPYDPTQLKGPGQPKPVTDPNHIQKNLVSAINAARAHNSADVFSQPQTVDVREQSTYCDARPGQNLTLTTISPTGLKIFVSNKILDPKDFYKLNSAGLEIFCKLIITCGEVFALAPSSLHVFHDESGDTIAFNAAGSVFCNYRFFAQLHLGGMHRPEGRAQAFVYWWVTLCHELAHNLVKDHSSAHSYYTEQFVAQYFTKVAETLIGMERRRITEDSAAVSTNLLAGAHQEIGRAFF